MMCSSCSSRRGHGELASAAQIGNDKISLPTGLAGGDRNVLLEKPDAHIRRIPKGKVSHSKAKIYILVSSTVLGRRVITGFDGRNVASFGFK